MQLGENRAWAKVRPPPSSQPVQGELDYTSPVELAIGTISGSSQENSLILHVKSSKHSVPNLAAGRASQPPDHSWVVTVLWQCLVR